MTPTMLGSSSHSMHLKEKALFLYNLVKVNGLKPIRSRDLSGKSKMNTERQNGLKPHLDIDN